MHHCIPVTSALLGAAVLLSPARAQDLPGEVVSFDLISATSGDFTGPLATNATFGWALTDLGDVDGNGVHDMAAGAPGLSRIFVLLMTADGSVGTEHAIASGEVPGASSNFGRGLAWLGDLDDDGNPEVAVGSVSGLTILTLAGPSASEPGTLVDSVHHTGVGGVSVAALGDRDGDSVPDMAVGSTNAVFLVDLNSDGSIKTSRELSQGQSGLVGPIVGDFGNAVTCLGDLDLDGVDDLAVGAENDDQGGLDKGAAWILLLNADGSVKAEQKISEADGNFTGNIDFIDRFGSSVAGVGDLDGDGLRDVAVGARNDSDGFPPIDTCCLGAVWILFLNADGTVKSHGKISDTAGNFEGGLNTSDLFGSGLAFRPDSDGDGNPELLVGAMGDQDAFSFGGALWPLQIAAADNAECFLVVGDGTGTGAFVPGSHSFATQVGAVESSYAVLLESIPEFVLPSRTWAQLGGASAGAPHAGIAGATAAVPAWMEDGEFTLQVVMWNPGVFPAQPEQTTHGLYVRLLPGGGVLTRPFGQGTGMTLSAETDVDAHGQQVVRFPFTIPGM